MHLQQHADMAQPGFLQGGHHADHRALDDIGAGPLDRRIDRCALAALPLGLVLRTDPREPGLAPEERFRIAAFADFLERTDDIFLDAGEALEIGVDHRLRLIRLDPQASAQAPARDAVEDREIDRLGASARIAIDLAEHLDRGAGVDVLALREGFLQTRHIGHMRCQPQLDLRIVGGKQDMARLGDEGLADLATDLGADRDVLQVGIGRAQPPGLRTDQAVAGMHPARLRVDRFLQRIGIGALELGELAPFEYLGRNRRAFARKAFEHALVGRILPALALLATLVAERDEQHFAQLLGAADGEFGPRNRVDFLLQPSGFAGEFLGQSGQPRAVDLDPVPLHLRHHRDQRAVDALVDLRPAFGREPRFQLLVEPPGDIGILGGICGRLVERHFAKGDRLAPGAAQFLEGQAGMAEMAFGQFVHPVTAADPVELAPGIEIEADDHRIVDRRYRHAVAREHVEIVFAVVEHLEHGIIRQQRRERLERGSLVDLHRLLGKHVAAAMTKRDIAGIIGAQRQADADQIALHAIERAGFGIDRDQPRGLRALDPGLEPVERLDAFIGAAIDRGKIGQRLAIARRIGGRTGRVALRRVEIGGARRAAIACLEPFEQAGEAMLAEEGGERFAGDLVELHVVERHGQAAILAQRHQHSAELGIGAIFEQAFLELAFLHALCRIERGGQSAMFGDQAAGSLGADTEDTGDVVDRIAHQRENIADLFGRDAEFLLDLLDIDARILHRVEHVDPRAVLLADKLHKILVGRDDRDVPPLPLRFACVGGDHVVRLDIGFLDARQAEGAGGVADQRELGHQILRRRGPVGLVLVVDLVAEAAARLVENHCQMRRPIGLVQIVGQLPQHGGIAIDRAHRCPFGVGQRGEAMIGTEDIGRAIDEVEMRCFSHGQAA